MLHDGEVAVMLLGGSIPRIKVRFVPIVEPILTGNALPSKLKISSALPRSIGICYFQVQAYRCSSSSFYALQGHLYPGLFEGVAIQPKFFIFPSRSNDKLHNLNLGLLFPHPPTAPALELLSPICCTTLGVKAHLNIFGIIF